MDDSQISRGGRMDISMNGTVVTDGVRELLVPDELYGRTDAPAKNTLEEYQVFTKLKRSKYFEARPDTVHFSGFVLGHRHQKLVKIVNVSHLTKRLHVLPCQSPYFTVHFNKKGKIAPGMAEELLVEFTPHEMRYYYDCIRIHQEDQNLIIPIHAYPTVAPRQGITMDGSSLVLPSQDADRSGIYFPSKIDFGFCRLSERTERVIPIQNPNPIEFEFVLNVTVRHLDIQVEPLRGKVPPHGQTLIALSYMPSRMVTAEMKFDLDISQFGWKTQHVVVMGSALAGATRDATVNHITHHLRETGQLSHERSLENYSVVRMPGDGRVDLTAVHDEAKGFAQKVEQLRNSRRPGQPIQIKRAAPPERELDSEMEGVMIPADLRPRAAVQKVLNQVTGKLSWKELKRQMSDSGVLPEEQDIQDPKAKANEAIVWYNSKRMQPGGFLDIEEEYGEGLRLQILEFRFAAEVRMRADYDAAKDIKFFPAIGDDSTTEEELELVALRRDARRRAREMQTREALRQQQGTVADESVKVAHEAGTLPQLQPTLDPYLNDPWTVRKEIIAGFRAQMHKIVVRQRVSRRMAAITHKLEQGGLTGGSAATLVDVILAADMGGGSAPGGGGGGKGGPEKLANMMTLEKVVSCTFPVYRDGNFRDREPVAVSEVLPILDSDFLNLKVPYSYKLMDYRREKPTPIPSYVSQETDRKFRQGAATEEGVRGARGANDAAAALDLKMPSFFKLAPEALCNARALGKGGGGGATTVMPHPTGSSASIGSAANTPVFSGAGGRSICRALDPNNRPAEGRTRGRCMVYAPLLDKVETDLDFALRPYPRVVGDMEFDTSLPGAAGRLGKSLNPEARGKHLNAAIFGPVIEGELVPEPEAPGFNTIRALRPPHAPLLSSKWLARRELPAVLCAGLPALMTGPDASDVMSDGEELDDTDPDYLPEPPVVIKPPTAASIRKEFKIPKWSESGVIDQEGGEVNTEVASEGEEEAEEEDPMKGFRVPLNARTMHEMELEQEVVQRRRALEQRLPDLLAEVNQHIINPDKKIPAEPSFFQPPVLQFLIREPVSSGDSDSDLDLSSSHSSSATYSHIVQRTVDLAVELASGFA